MTHTHFIGIGGTGLSAIARVLLERGQIVSGSDHQTSPLTKRIQQAGAAVYIGHNAKNIVGADIVIRSSAVPDDNVEVLAAQQAGIPVLKRADYLGQLLDGFTTIAVAGSHGKTTTTSMIVWILTTLNLKPGFIVGGQVENLSTNASAGSSPYFVIEADEYDYMFWGLNPHIAVVTNVEHDHPDCFPTPQSFTEAFQGFVTRIQPDGTLVACLDDPGAAQLMDYAGSQDRQTRAYGLDFALAHYTARDMIPRRGSGYSFTALRSNQELTQVSLQIPGKHNVRNALAALAVADLLKLNPKEAAEALADFRGSGRRFEELGVIDGVTIIDDYGHHPTEIKATLSAARDRYPGSRIWAVWQPHTYSRTTQLVEDFGVSFSKADQVVITKVYAARESRPKGFKHQQLVEAIQHPHVRFCKKFDHTADLLLAEVKPGDIVIVFSAGDANAISAMLYAGLRQREGLNA
jgi:UDP-N-acetylmuramate--alanine ligase